jgi:hypothetical protein
MQIVSERNAVPRPVQNPSDLERRPIEFGIEALPPAPQKPDGTILKATIQEDMERQDSSTTEAGTVEEQKPAAADKIATPDNAASPDKPESASKKPEPIEDEEWGEGVF